MDTLEDIERERGYEELVDEISAQAIEQFTLDRMRSYYVNNRFLAEKVIKTYKEANRLLPISPTASTVLFTTSIEVGLKVLLLKPVIYGLVHNHSVADLISDLAVKNNGIDRFRPLLGKLLSEYGNIDSNEFRIAGHQRLLWDEIKDVQDLRNRVVHRGEMVSPENAVLPREVALMILGHFFPSVLKALHLRLLNDSIQNI